jgi:hypothetical protein
MNGGANAVVTVVLGCCLTAVGSSAQQAAPAERPQFRARPVDAGPTLDGDVLGDPVWVAAEVTEGFWQTAPDEGSSATERTTVRVVFTESTLYLGVVCHDREPARIIVADSRRDSSLSETDSFQVAFDTYQDHRTGFVFGTNPAGIEYDGQITSEGEGGFGSAGGFNLNWDGAWEVRARIAEEGWSAELAIPFSTLRFARGGEQNWGINFQRNIRRRNETAYWAALPRQFDLNRLSLAGTLVGVAPPSPHILQLTPYVLAETNRRGAEDQPDEDDQEVGVDLKYGVTPSLTLDLTYNTDFAQVEADTQQINLDRFNLFFPEKRPFFLENAGLFSIGVAGELELFFSRRIGIGPDGEVIPILGGARLSGKAGRNNLGFLLMRSEDVDGVAPRNDFAVARYSRDLAKRSQLGVLFVGRQGHGPLAARDDENFTFALDGRVGIGQNALVQSFVARTQTPGIEGDEHAFRFNGSWSSQAWEASGGYTEVGEGFNPEVGFLAREGYRKADLFVLRRIRPQSLWGLQELRPHVSAFSFWDFDGYQESGRVHIDNHWEWKNGYEVHTGFNLIREGVKESFEIADGVSVPEGTYDYGEGQLVFLTNRGAPASFEMRVVYGGFFGGDRRSLSPTFRFRLGETFNTELRWSYNDIDLPGGAFETNLGRLRLSYSFTPRLFVQALVQYNDRADAWATNLRLGWLQAANSGLFVVYDEIRDIGGIGNLAPDRSLSIKFSRLFDLRADRSRPRPATPSASP